MRAWTQENFQDSPHIASAATDISKPDGLGGRTTADLPFRINGEQYPPFPITRATSLSTYAGGMALVAVPTSTFLSPKHLSAQDHSPEPAFDTWTATRPTTTPTTSLGEPTLTTRTTNYDTEPTTVASQTHACLQSRFETFAPALTAANFTKTSPDSSASAVQPLPASRTAPSGKTLRILVGCEFSGIVREAFRSLGHDAWSCDILPSEDNSPYHLQCDVLTVLDSGWDIAIFHPPCTHLAVSGARWFKGKLTEQAEALEFVRALMAAPIERIAIENPISIISSRIRKPDQIIQPWQFGHGETKATCLWLKGLPLLVPTDVVDGREARIHRMPPGPDRWKERSRTFEGVANAMAAQWSGDALRGVA